MCSTVASLPCVSAHTAFAKPRSNAVRSAFLSGSTQSSRQTWQAQGLIKTVKANCSNSAVLTGRSLVVATAAVAGIDELKSKYDIPGFVEVQEGNGGLPKVVLKHASGAGAEVYLFGACITSFTQPSGDDVLYVRSDAKFDGKKPISGGIPHCFPQFGPGAMQQHGFARNLTWEVASTSADLQPDEKDPEVELVLTDNDYTRAMFPFAFKAVYTVTLHNETLKTVLRVINNDSKPFEFTAALHSYIEVLDIGRARVGGLQGLTYLDKTSDPNNPTKKQEDRQLVIFGGPVDSVYLDAPQYLELDVGTGAAVAISNQGWDDAVVWSPWTTMEADYKRFCCVENAKTGTPAKVAPGESWTASMDMHVVDLQGAEGE